MADPYKLRVKLGAHEFEAEGTEDAVKEQFNAWKDLISTLSQTTRPAGPSVPPVSRLHDVVEEVRTKDGFNTQTWDIFICDDKRKLITLKVNPSGETRDPDAALLVMYGYKRAFQMDEVKVGRLKEALAVSGLRPDRMDRTLSDYIAKGFLLKTGRGPGGKYRLTTTGYDRADALAKNLFEQLV